MAERTTVSPHDGPGQTVDQVAQLCGISSRRVQQLEKEGIFRKASRGRYNALECVHAYIKYWQERAMGSSVRYSEARADRTEVQAERERLQLAQLRRELIAADEVLQMVRGPLEQVDASLRSVPARYAADLAAKSKIKGGIRSATRLLEDIIERVRADLRGLREHADDSAEAA